MSSNSAGINLHFFANDRLKPRVMLKNEELDTLYPLYGTLVFGQTNTQFRVLIDGVPVLVSTDLSELNTDPLGRVINDYKLDVLKLVQKEASMVGFDKYSVSGFGKRLKKYEEGFVNFFCRQPIKSIVDFCDILEGWPDKNSMIVDFRDTISTIIGTENNKVSLLEWFIGDGKKQIKKLLMDSWADESNVGPCIEMLDDYIQKHLFIEPKSISFDED